MNHQPQALTLDPAPPPRSGRWLRSRLRPRRLPSPATRPTTPAVGRRVPTAAEGAAVHGTNGPSPLVQRAARSVRLRTASPSLPDRRRAALPTATRWASTPPAGRPAGDNSHAVPKVTRPVSATPDPRQQRGWAEPDWPSTVESGVEDPVWAAAPEKSVPLPSPRKRRHDAVPTRAAQPNERLRSDSARPSVTAARPAKQPPNWPVEAVSGKSDTPLEPTMPRRRWSAAKLPESARRKADSLLLATRQIRSAPETSLPRSRSSAAAGSLPGAPSHASRAKAASLTLTPGELPQPADLPRPGSAANPTRASFLTQPPARPTEPGRLVGSPVTASPGDPAWLEGIRAGGHDAGRSIGQSIRQVLGDAIAEEVIDVLERAFGASA